MKRPTPALDRLTTDVASQVTQAVSRQMFPRFLGNDEEPLILPVARQYIKDADISAELIRQLYSAGRIRGHDYLAAREHSMQRTARELGLSQPLVETVSKVLFGLKSAISEVISENLRQSDDAGIAAVLIDLYYVDYDDFNPDLADNELDYNADDLLPEGCETPHNHLSDLIADAVTARIIKRDGRELMLSWLQTCGGSR